MRATPSTPDAPRSAPSTGHDVAPTRSGSASFVPGRLSQTPRPPTHGGSVTGGTRPFDRDGQRPSYAPPHRTSDHRYARPDYRHVRPSPNAYAPPPARVYYRPYYTRWWVHPYYRYLYATNVVVGFGFSCAPWTPAWVPPVRTGWGWIPGLWVGSVWTPGYWAPVGVAPVGYTYVSGFWDGTVYVDGFYRPQQRTDGAWAWIDGYYMPDGTYVRGTWRPTAAGPQGYTWEAGFWDGETWVDGFWRPEYRTGYTWVSAYYDEEGIFHGGYWAPLQQLAGHVWVPGWFDGNQWVEGYWVPGGDYEAEDVQAWQPDDGWHDGWEPEGARPSGPPPGGTSLSAPSENEMPLGIPVQ